MTDEPDFEGKRLGRPKTGQGRRVRVPAELEAPIQAFADDQFTDYADAVRQLIEKGLARGSKE